MLLYHLAMSLGNRFCQSRKGGRGQWVHPKGECDLAVERHWVGHFCSQKCVQKATFCSVGPPCQATIFFLCHSGQADIG